jgi:microcystin-dependent protein
MAWHSEKAIACETDARAMSNPYIGEIRMFGANFAPSGWALCQGQLLPISQYEALFNLIGTTYGGDGMTTFGLPDLRGRLPAHQGTPAITNGTSIVMGQNVGVDSVTLVTAELPVHTHTAQGSHISTTGTPAGTLWAGGSGDAYSPAAPSARLSAQAVSSTGSSQAHQNLSPYLVVNFIIALFGIFPSQN